MRTACISLRKNWKRKCLCLCQRVKFSSNTSHRLNQGPWISIFFRPDRYTGSQMVFSSFPRAVASAFSPRLDRYLQVSANKSFIIFGGSLKAHKKLFEYMLDCCAAGKIIPFPDVDMENTINPFVEYAKLMESATYFEIFELQRSMYKRAMLLARKHLMNAEEAETYIAGYDPGAAMMDIAVESIAYAFHAGQFDDNEEANKQVGDLRDAYPWFSKALEEKIPRVPGEIKEANELARQKREERKAREAGGGFSDGDENDFADSGAAGSGWDQEQAATTTSAGGWDNDNNDWAAMQATSDWATADTGGVSNWEQPGVAHDQPQDHEAPVNTPSVQSPATGW